MEFSHKHNIEDSICVVEVSGNYKRPSDTITLQEFCRDFKKKSGCSKYLMDMRKATIMATDIDTYEAVANPNVKGLNPFEFKLAMLYSGDLAPHQFLEDTAVNRGFNLKIFNDYNEAYSWLP